MQKWETRPALVADDVWLEANEQDVKDRISRFYLTLEDIDERYGSLEAYAAAHDIFGFHYDKKRKGWLYREWAPAAHQLYLTGDFNGWNRTSHPLARNEFGDWEIFLPDTPDGPQLKHEQRVKVNVLADNGSHDRIPPYIRRAIQDPKSHDFSGQIWAPEKPFKWSDTGFKVNPGQAPFIYEAHLGLATENEGVGTYSEFADNVLPRIEKLGYNTVQLMAIQEHPYYGSFGYHVSNLFAPTSRFGTPEDLKYLVNKAHGLGIAVIMDIVHSHAVKNLAEGLNLFDGSDSQYFHSGARGYHDGWDSLLFDYGKEPVQRFLLSNVKYWLEEFHFDGFRFDGVTSMMYFHHGNIAFDHYDRYFRDGVEWDAILYLQLACEVAHRMRPDSLMIAEDMSGMPGLCRKQEEGGVGFDYRLGMGLPDYWIKLLKHSRDEDWNIHQIWATMTNRRYKEKTIAYAESHDQALVGDKTLAFWLMDKEMYWHMDKADDNLVIDRGIALHKLIRIVTMVLGGEGYLNFIGNEFGHPEWIDFPREGNNWSYKYARRQWSLVDNEELKYEWLNEFDAAMVRLMKENHVLESPIAQQLNMDEANKTIVCERANLVFVFNLHHHNSIPDYKFNVPEGMKGNYRLILNSDRKEFGGFGRVDDSIDYKVTKGQLSVYATNRTALVFQKVS